MANSPLVDSKINPPEDFNRLIPHIHDQKEVPLDVLKGLASIEPATYTISMAVYFFIAITTCQISPLHSQQKSANPSSHESYSS